MARHILIIVENLPVPFDRRVWQEATALREAGHEVTVICPRAKGQVAPRETLDGIRIYRHWLPEAEGVKGYLIEYPVALIMQTLLSFLVRLRHGAIHTIQGCSPPDLIWLVALLHRPFGTRYVFDHHDLSPELYETKFARRDGFYRLLLWMERMTFRLSRTSIATNETFKEIAVARGGMDPEDVFVVKSYPRLERFKRTDPHPQIAGLGKTIVGYIGIMGAQDGVDMMIDALAELRARGRDDLHGLIIGDGPEWESLKAHAEARGLGDAITFTGYQSGDALMAYLSAIDIGVIPDPPDAFNSKLSMNKVFEYMMLALPFTLFDLAQARSEAGAAGQVVEEHSAPALADALAALADDPERRAEMGRVGRIEAEASFRWENEVEALLAAHARAARR
ncbi:MAG: glycosyltransferase family 4 protein [Pseudomonadota bacterium]